MVFGALLAFAIVIYVLLTHQFAPIALRMIPAVLVIDVITCIILAFSKKVVKVSDDGIQLRTRPLAYLLNRQIPFDQIADCQVQAPTIGTMGNPGLRLQLASGQSIVIGSQKIDELVALIQARIK